MNYSPPFVCYRFFPSESDPLSIFLRLARYSLLTRLPKLLTLEDEVQG